MGALLGNRIPVIKAKKDSNKFDFCEITIEEDGFSVSTERRFDTAGYEYWSTGMVFDNPIDDEYELLINSFANPICRIKKDKGYAGIVDTVKKVNEQTVLVDRSRPTSPPSNSHLPPLGIWEGHRFEITQKQLERGLVSLPLRVAQLIDGDTIYYQDKPIFKSIPMPPDKLINKFKAYQLFSQLDDSETLCFVTFPASEKVVAFAILPYEGEKLISEIGVVSHDVALSAKEELELSQKHFLDYSVSMGESFINAIDFSDNRCASVDSIKAAAKYIAKSINGVSLTHSGLGDRIKSKVEETQKLIQKADSLGLLKGLLPAFTNSDQHINEFKDFLAAESMVER